MNVALKKADAILALEVAGRTVAIADCDDCLKGHDRPATIADLINA